jgi:serine/threonine-protein kinase PRP4
LFCFFIFKEKVSVLYNIPITRDIQNELMPPNQRLPDDQKKKVKELKDLLEKIIVIDPTKRIGIRQAIVHPFVDEKM